MAFDTKTFKTRAATATVFVIVMLAGLLWNAWAFIILFTVIHFGCWYEFVQLVKKIKPEKYFYYVPFGMLYITLPILVMIYLRVTGNDHKGSISFSEFGRVLPCGIIFSIWVNDTMAYIVGSLIGRTPLSKISPKKTWEGTIGGIILCALTISLIGMATGFFTITDWIIIAASSAIFGTLGDLLESKLKRSAKVKDSGTFMPGHGGFLDRFDSLLTASMAVGLYYFFFM